MYFISTNTPNAISIFFSSFTFSSSHITHDFYEWNFMAFFPSFPSDTFFLEASSGVHTYVLLEIVVCHSTFFFSSSSDVHPLNPLFLFVFIWNNVDIVLLCLLPAISFDFVSFIFVTRSLLWFFIHFSDRLCCLPFSLLSLSFARAAGGTHAHDKV